MNSINWPASSVWVFIAQLGEHCSANAEATGSNPVEAPKIFFSGYFRNCLNCDSLRWSHTHFINTHFIKYNGLSYCNKCFHSIGHILGYNEITESDRCCFHQKSIYKRDYHYQNKIEEINKKCNLKMSSDEKYELLLKLQKIDNKVMKK